MTGWVESIIDNWGSLGVALLMFLENVFPPIPSELVLPLAGYRVSEGSVSLAGSLVSSTVGSVAGVSIWYFAGRWLGDGRLKRFARSHGRWLTLTPSDIDKVNQWFGRHGAKAVVLGRLVPGVRTLISVPAGISGMPLATFLLLTAFGTAAWNSALVLLGYWLGSNFERVGQWVGPIGNVIIGGALLYYLYRVITFRRHVDKTASASSSR